jgi:hypothetical protein
MTKRAIASIIDAVTRELKRRVPGVETMSEVKAPVSGADADVFIRVPKGADESALYRTASAIASRYNAEYGVWVLPIIEPRWKIRTHDVRPVSERVRATARTRGGWKPRAEVWLYNGHSIRLHPVEPARTMILPTKREADTVALRVAQRWLARKGLSRRRSAS